MFKQANKRLNRIGCESIKVVFTIHVKKVLFSQGTFVDYDGSYLSVCFERGGKLASSKDKLFESAKSPSHSMEINESLSLLVTLYRDPNNQFQEKYGKLVVRQLRKSKNILLAHIGGYKGIGTVKLALHELVDQVAEDSKEVTLSCLEAPAISLVARLSVKFVNKDEDDGSVLSGSGLSDGSEASTMAAVFESESSSGARSHGGSQNNSARMPSPERARVKASSTDCSGKKHGSSSGGSDDAEGGLAASSTAVVAAKRSNSSLTSIAEGGADAEEERRGGHGHHESKSAGGALKALTSAVASLAHQHSSSAADEIGELARLQRQLQSRDAEIAELRRAQQLQEETARAQVTALRTELNMAQLELKRMQHGRTALAIANEKADGVLASALARAREEAAQLAEECAAAEAARQAHDEELAACRADCERVKLAWAEEQKVSLAAAAQASEAQHRRAALEQEVAELVDELVTVKLKYATVAQECEEERARFLALKRRLQKYAERVAALEVSRALPATRRQR